jgi:hypothetical protein
MNITFGAVQLREINVTEPDTVKTVKRSKKAGTQSVEVTQIPLSASLTVLPEQQSDLNFKTLPGLQAGNLPNQPVELSLAEQEDNLLLTAHYAKQEEYRSYRQEAYQEAVTVGYRHVPAGKFYYTWHEAYDEPITEWRTAYRDVFDGIKTRLVTQEKTVSLTDAKAFMEFTTLLQQLASANQDAARLLKLVKKKGRSMFSQITAQLKQQVQSTQTAIAREITALQEQLEPKKARLQEQLTTVQQEAQEAEALLAKLLGGGKKPKTE